MNSARGARPRKQYLWLPPLVFSAAIGMAAVLVSVTFGETGVFLFLLLVIFLVCVLLYNFWSGIDQPDQPNGPDALNERHGNDGLDGLDLLEELDQEAELNQVPASPCYHTVDVIQRGKLTSNVRVAKRVNCSEYENCSMGGFSIKENMPESVWNPSHPEWHHYPDSEKVVIKVISLPYVPELNGEEDDLSVATQEWQKLKEEISLVIKLKHPNVLCHYLAQLLPQHQDADHRIIMRRCLLFMEWCQGDLLHHLHTLFRDRSRVPLSNYGSQILNALEYIHQAGIVHADIKAANILVKYVNGLPVLKVADFGEMAIILLNMTLPDTCPKCAGTVSHMSPEMLEKNGRNSKLQVGRLTDIYSLGCVLLELVSIDTDFPDNKTHYPQFCKRAQDGTTTLFDWPTILVSSTVPQLATVTEPNHADAVLTFFEDNGRVRVKHSPRLAVVKDRNGVYYAVRQPFLNEEETRLWMTTTGYEPGWKEYKKVIHSCLRPLRPRQAGSPHSYAVSRDDGPDSELRPISDQLLADPIFAVEQT